MAKPKTLRRTVEPQDMICEVFTDKYCTEPAEIIIVDTDNGSILLACQQHGEVWG